MSTKCDPSITVDTTTEFRCALDLTRYALGDGRALVYAPQFARSEILSAQEMQLLQSVQGSATLECHAISLCRQLALAPHTVAQLHEQLKSLAARKLLVSDLELKTVLRANYHDKLDRKITALGISACDDPEALERCVRSYGAKLLQLGRQMQVYVTDDSRPELAAQNRERLEATTRALKIDVAYSDRQSREEFCQALSSHANVPLDAVRLALLASEFLHTSGGNLNTFALSTVGQLALLVGQDTLCDLTAPAGRETGVQLTSEYTPTTFWGKKEDQGPGDEDLFSVHERLLGRSLGALIDEGASLTAVKHSFFKNARPESSVAVTSVGEMFSSSLSQLELLLRLDGPAHGRLTTDEQSFAAIMQHGAPVQGVARATVSSESFSTSLNIAIDNTQVLPPFVPVRQNQEKCFANLLQANSGACYFGFLPEILTRQSNSFTGDSGVKLTSGDIVFAFLRSYQPLASIDPRHGFSRLGEFLIDWGTAPLADFEQEIKRIASILASTKIERLEALLKKFGQRPHFWADAVRTKCSQLKSAVAAPDYVIAADFARQSDNDEARARMQKLVLNLGQLLCHWLPLRQAAAELQAKGNLPYRMISK
ncbi:MAG TPA: hypothetical protein V6C81_14145 [Planktothrix sp.]|jgi:hypothetical protein